MANSNTVCLKVQAAGRRQVLRGIAADSEVAPEMRSFWYEWKGLQPSLLIELRDPVNHARQVALKALVEHRLDVGLARHPWDEIPLLEWSDDSAAPFLSVEIVARAGSIDPAELVLDDSSYSQLQRIGMYDGSKLKESWIGFLQEFLSSRPLGVTSIDRLLEGIGDDLRPAVVRNLDRVRSGSFSLSSYSGDLAALGESLTKGSETDVVRALHALANRLALHPRESAYAMLLANAMASASIRIENEC